jgi:DNA-binding helix-hairpin-helix protein with protein kinase domain
MWMMHSSVCANEFLEQFYISKAKIKGIGRNRTIVLRSYGIETAADVQRHTILQINGFGPVIAGSLVAWRISIERRFVFKANEPLNPADVTAVRTAILKKKSELETKLQRSLARLERASNETRSMRNSLSGLRSLPRAAETDQQRGDRARAAIKRIER